MRLLLVVGFWFVALALFLGSSLQILNFHKPDPVQLGLALFVAGFIVAFLYEKVIPQA